MIRIRFHAETKLYQAPTPRSTDFGELTHSFLIGSASPACIAGHPGVLSHWQLYKRERSLAAFEQMLTLSPREGTLETPMRLAAYPDRS